MFEWIGIRAAKDAWKIARLENDEFVNEMDGLRGDGYEAVSLAGNFIPERYDNPKIAMRGLRMIVEKWGITDLRIGIRWSIVDSGNGKLDLSYYKPFLEYCFTHSVDIVLSIGPIKTPAYPEEFVPDYIWKEIGTARKYTVIRSQSDLANKAVQYQRQLLEYLKIYLSPGKLARIKYFQIENECFTRFGHFMLKSSVEYIRQIIVQTQEFFPGKPILLNSSGRLGLRQILKTLDPLRGRFCVGQDYYYQDQWRTQAFWKVIEPMGWLLFPWNISNEQLQQKAEERGYFLEITETQVEPWHPVYDPGNSVVSLRFVLYICLKSAFAHYKREPVLRLWGLEYLTKQYLEKSNTSEHNQIVSLIRSLTRP